MEFRLLGGVAAEVDGREVDLGHVRQRLVLAALLVSANRTVTVDGLIDRVWGESPPSGAVKTLRSYLTRLRPVLAATGAAAIERRPGGYSLVVTDHVLVDIHQFTELVARARAEVDRHQAVELFRRALALWQGDALVGMDSSWARELRDDLTQKRISAERDYADLLLLAGRHTELLPDLLAASRKQPLDERLAGQLMLALYRSGRQGEALAHYDGIRQLLAEELGADPGAALQRLHQQILTNDADAAAPAPPTQPAPTPSAVPRQLPAPPAWFAGRVREVGELTRALTEARQAGTVAVAGLFGSGGVGKTALALHWAHRHSSEFPDGQLYANLRGFDPAVSPTPWDVVVRTFLEALGVRGAAVPADPDAQAALYRSTVSGRRMLIVLDNARDSAQVTPLLPGSPACAVLVTSRDRLAGLSASHGARPLPVDILADSEARTLLAARLGDARLTQEPTATAQLLKHCAGLPLALSILAGRAGAAPALSLSALADELRDVSTRLGVFDDGEPGASLPAVLSWSFAALSAEQTRVAGLLGLAPGPDISVLAAANLTGLSPARAGSLLRSLERVSLLQQAGSGRYRMHDLVRLYAAEHADDELPASARREAMDRLTDFYTHTALTGNKLLHPHSVLTKTSAPEPDRYPHPHEFADKAAALGWFEAEHACLLATQRHALSEGRYHTVWQLAWAFTAYHHHRAGFHYDHTVWRAAVEAAGLLEEPAVELIAHRRLGLASARCGRHLEALEHLHQALTLAEAAEDVSAQAIIHHNLAQSWELHGQDREALGHAFEALRRFQKLDNPVWLAQALNGVGWYLTRLGEHEQARVHCENALALYLEHNRHGAADVLDSLGHIAHHTGRYTDALDRYHQALLLYRESGNSYMEADTLDHLGETHVALGEHSRAAAVWQQALDMYRAQNRPLNAQNVQARIDALQPGEIYLAARFIGHQGR